MALAVTADPQPPTLLEEFAHLKSGEKDCTRGFQNWLFDQLLVNAERFAGEPF